MLRRVRVTLASVSIAAVVGLVVGLLAGGGAVNAASGGIHTLYPAGTIPALASENDSSPVELGVRFSANVAGTVTGVRFYKSDQNTGTHTGTLWSSTGTKLASATFTAESSSGWQTVSFSSPVAVKAKQTYVASYHTTTGHYAQKEYTFADGATIGDSVLTGRVGTYAYGSGSFPGNAWHDAAYYVDVLFSAGGTTTTTTAPTTKVSTTTASAPTSVSSSSAVPPVATTSASQPATTAAAPTSHGAASPTTTTTKATTTTTKTTTGAVPANAGAAQSAGAPAGLALTAMAGTTIRTAGTVIDAKNISGSITIAAANVVISRSRISGSGGTGINVVSGSVTITNTTVSGFDDGIAGDNYTATGVEVTALKADGFKLGTNVTITSSWCHALTPGTGAHADCAQLQSGERNVVVQGSYFDPGASDANSALFIAPDLGPSTNGPITIANNILGGGNYTLFCVDGNNGEYYVQNITISGNRFLRDSQYGPVRVNVPVTASNNVWNDTGAAVSFSQ